MEPKSILVGCLPLDLKELMEVQDGVAALIEKKGGVAAADIPRELRSFYKAFSDSTKDTLGLKSIEVFRATNKKGYVSLIEAKKAVDDLFKDILKGSKRITRIKKSRLRAKYYRICFDCVLLFLERRNISALVRVVLNQLTGNVKFILNEQYPSYISNGIFLMVLR